MNKKVFLLLSFLILGLAFFLRIFQLTTLTAPYWEEVALGYDAFSIAQTLRDHHGNFLPLMAFESFGDWKPSLYFYAIVPLVKILGLNVWAVRLPSVLAGISIVLGSGVLISQILDHKKLFAKDNFNLSLWAMFIATISPWAIMFSRAGWEVNLATALILWGVISFLHFLDHKKIKFLLISITLLIASMYTYHATRMIAPLLGLGLVFVWFNQSQQKKSSSKNKFHHLFSKFITSNFKSILIATGLSLLLALPIILGLFNPTTSQRFKETSIFSDISVIEESNLRQTQQPGIISKIFYHRYTLFGQKIAQNYLSHFNLNFLFVSGDSNPRHSTQFMGHLYHIELVFVLMGLFWIFKNWKKHPRLKFLLFWLLIGIIPASLTKAVPHGLRILPTLPVFIMIITLGITQFLRMVTNLISSVQSKFTKPLKLLSAQLWQKIAICIILLAYLLELGVFWRHYTQIYPVSYSSEWQHGYQQMFDQLDQLATEQNEIYITREQGRPAMYYWFYHQTRPQLVQAQNSTNKKDQGEYLEFTDLRHGQTKDLTFVNSINEVVNLPAVVVASPQQTDLLKSNNQVKTLELNQIKNKDNQTVWVINQVSTL